MSLWRKKYTHRKEKRKKVVYQELHTGTTGGPPACQRIAGKKVLAFILNKQQIEMITIKEGLVITVMTKKIGEKAMDIGAEAGAGTPPDMTEIEVLQIMTDGGLSTTTEGIIGTMYRMRGGMTDPVLLREDYTVHTAIPSRLRYRMISG